MNPEYIESKLDIIDFPFKRLKNLIQTSIEISLDRYNLEAGETMFNESNKEEFLNKAVNYYDNCVKIFNQSLKQLKENALKNVETPNNYLEKTFDYINFFLNQNDEFLKMNEDLIFYDVITYIRRYKLRSHNESKEEKESLSSIKKHLPYLLKNLISRVIDDKKMVLLLNKQTSDEWTEFFYNKFQDPENLSVNSLSDIISEHQGNPFELSTIMKKTDEFINENCLKYIKEFHHYESRKKIKNKTLTHFFIINILKCFPAEIFDDTINPINRALLKYEFREYTDKALKYYTSNDVKKEFLKGNEFKSKWINGRPLNENGFNKLNKELSNEVNKVVSYDPEINSDSIIDFGLSCAKLLKNFFLNFLNNKLTNYTKKENIDNIIKNYGNAIILAHQESFFSDKTNEFNLNYNDINDKILSEGFIKKVLFPDDLRIKLRSFSEKNEEEYGLLEPDINDVRSCYSRIELTLENALINYLICQSNELYNKKISKLQNMLDMLELFNTEYGKELEEEIKNSDYKQGVKMARKINETILLHHFNHVKEVTKWENFYKNRFKNIMEEK